jgi:hypothetical protein
MKINNTEHYDYLNKRSEIWGRYTPANEDASDSVKDLDWEEYQRIRLSIESVVTTNEILWYLYFIAGKDLQ